VAVPAHEVAADHARQPSVPAWQVWICAPAHCVAPADGHAFVHDATHAFTDALHVCDPGHAAGAPHARQPVAPDRWQVWSAAPEHCVAPADGHASVHPPPAVVVLPWQAASETAATASQPENRLMTVSPRIRTARGRRVPRLPTLPRRAPREHLDPSSNPTVRNPGRDAHPNPAFGCGT
jgi:hypothetical protein